MMTDMKGSTSIATHIHDLHKEWDEASCPICMDHPHNAVLILCSSYDKGCRPYICDSSYRHSNCLDRFKKYFGNGPLGLDQESLHDYTNESVLGASRMRNNSTEVNENNNLENNGEELHRYLEMRDNGIVETGGLEHFGQSTIGGGNLSDSNLNLKCLLCRGTVKGWKIVEEARQYLDLKQRSCSLESCSFFGNYVELRRHARKDHPTTRPAVIDPSRQRTWPHLKPEQDYGDIVSAIRSAMPGAIVLGDYAIEIGDGNREGSDPFLTSFILYQMMRPFERRGMSRPWRRYRRSSGPFSDRRNLWGENLLGLQDDEEDWNLESETGGDITSIPRRRRRFTRSRPDEDLP